MHTLGHITDQELADISAHAGPGRPRAAPAERLHRRHRRRLLLRLRVQLPDRHAGPDARRSINNGGWTIQTTLQPDMQRSGDQAVLTTSPMGDRSPASSTPSQPGTGHVLAMSVNRRYGCDGPRLRVGQPQRARPARRRVDVQGVHRRRGPVGRASASHYTINAPQPYTSKVYKKNGGTGRRRTWSATTTPATRDLQHDAGRRLVQHLLRGPRGRAGQRRGPGATSPRRWACTSTTRRTSTPPTTHRQNQSARSPSAPTRPARWTSPARTPRSPPAAPSATRPR